MAASVKDVKAQEVPFVELPTNEKSEKLLKIRHSSAHIMAMAVQRLHKDAQVTIGPWIENGFYYDFDLKGKTFDETDLKNIRKEMIKIINKNLPITREVKRMCFLKQKIFPLLSKYWPQVVSREEALSRIQKLNEPYKIELLEAIPKGNLLLESKHSDYTEVQSKLQARTSASIT
jgi:threonyl-tRNA synthetase